MRATLSVFCLAVLAACGGGGDIAVETCERLDECNVLGTSVNDCTEELDLILGDLTPTEQRDFERLMDDCLEFEGCGTFLDCAGFSDDGGDTGGGGGGGTSDPDGGGPAPGDTDPGTPAP
jgi:hypothetical protein